MSASQQLHPNRELQIRGVPHASRHLDEHILRALNKIRKPSTAEEITDLLNSDLDPGDRPFEPTEVASWLKNANNEVLGLYWLGTRPRR